MPSHSSPRRDAAIQTALLCPVCQKKFPLYACLANEATNHINKCIASLECNMKRKNKRERKNLSDNDEKNRKRASEVNDEVEFARPKSRRKSNSSNDKLARSSKSRRKSAVEQTTKKTKQKTSSTKHPSSSRHTKNTTKRISGGSRRKKSAIQATTLKSRESSSDRNSNKKSLKLQKPTTKMISPYIQHVIASHGASRETVCVCQGRSVNIDLLTTEGYDALRETLMRMFLDETSSEFDDIDIAYLNEKQQCRWLSDGTKGSRQQANSSDMKEVDWVTFCEGVQKVFVYLRRGPVN